MRSLKNPRVHSGSIKVRTSLSNSPPKASAPRFSRILALPLRGGQQTRADGEFERSEFIWLGDASAAKRTGSKN
jgi:hypothetical protein